ncbi:hypothetical protein V6N13_027411 [Hibiscus sabdariffa]
MCKCRSHGTFPLFGLQSSHLNICYYHQDLHRRPQRPCSRPGFYGDRRTLLLIGAWPLPRRSGIGHALKRHPFSGLVDSADSLVRVSRRAGWGARRPTPGARWCRSTPRRRVLGSTIEVTTSPWAYQRPELGPPPRSASSFSSFPHGTCSLSVSRPYLALDGIYRPIRVAFPNNPTRRQRLVVRQGPGTTGLSPSPAPLSRGLGPGPSLRTLLQTTIRTPRATDSQVGLFPVRSPLLRESFGHVSTAHTPRTGVRQQTTTFSFRFLGVIHAGGCLFCHGDTGSRVSETGRRWSAMMRPHPLPRILDNMFTGRSARQVQWTSRDVAGSEPPTSPRSEHFTGPLNRQIALPTKNGHAPPPIESRKSSQSVNPYYVWTCARGTTRPIKARSASPAVGTSRPVLTVRRTGRPTPRINQVAFLRDVCLAWSSTHYLGRGEAITGREHRSCRGTKCKSYERTRPRPYAHEIFRFRKND